MTTFTDTEIERQMARGSLVKKGDPSRLAGATYELRLGNVYYDLTETDQPIQVQPGGTILIKPGHRVVLITHEELSLPDDVFARIVTKGSLFSVGLAPISTYADPGFEGNIGIVTQNISDKYIVLPQLEPVAKVYFTRLNGTAAKPYRGQHGFQTQIWPIKHQLQKSHADLKTDPRVKSEKEEAYQVIPHAAVKILRSLESRQRLVDISLLVAVVVNAASLALASTKVVDVWMSIVGNLITSAIVALIVVLSKRA